MCAYACHGVHVEIDRRQLFGVSNFLLCGPGDLTQAFQVCVARSLPTELSHKPQDKVLLKIILFLFMCVQVSVCGCAHTR